jgi:2-desacetyl-2-hydroxyethyl bacteriochlorophyllide A dehydrogenase
MRRLVFTGPKQIKFEDLPDEPLTPTSVRIRCLYSGISHGTEMSFYRGTAPHLTNEIKGGLFRKSKESTTSFPVWHGYETVGEIIEVGSAVKGFNLGDIVWSGNSHADSVVCDTAVGRQPFFIEKAPVGADPTAGIFLALSGVAMDGHLTSCLRLGESAVISGLGVIGLFCVQIAALAGVRPLVAVDPIEVRRKKAMEFGADCALDPTTGSVAEQVRDLNTGKGVDAAIETSGNWKALHEAIRCCASGYGRVVALGFYQGGGSDLRLGEEFHHSSFQPMGASSILAIRHRPEPAPGRPWDRVRVYHTMALMLGEKRLKVDGLLTHTFPYAHAAEAFELVDQHPEKVIKVALTF